MVDSPICGLCSRVVPGSTHVIREWDGGHLAAICGNGSGPISDVSDQDTLRELAEGAPHEHA